MADWGVGRSVALLLAWGVLPCVLPVLHAQEGERQGGVEEIVVRARRRAELLEDTPVSVTALSGEVLRATQAESLEDVAALVPNLTILSGRSSQDASIVIRGVGAFPFIYFDQGVGVYVDGVYLSRQQGSLLDIVDLQQVEVLRGPQGTLFGKNTVGGAINITTTQPKNELEGFVQIRGGNFGTFDTKSTLNIPIDHGWFEDKLAMRFTFANFYNDGYTKNRIGDRHSDRNSLNFLGSARLQATDDLVFTLAGSWTREQNRGLGGRCVVIQEDGFDAAPFINQDYPGFYDACRRSRNYRFSSDLNGFANSISYGIWGIAEWDLGPQWFFEAASLRYTGSWREQETAIRDDAEMTEFPVFTIAQLGEDSIAAGEPQDARQIQQEVVFNGETLDGRLSIVGGVFTFWEDAQTNTGLRFMTGNAVIDSVAVNGTTDNFVETDNWDWAIFSQAVLDITDWLSVTAGIRYTQESKKLVRALDNALFDEDEDGDPVPVGEGVQPYPVIPRTSLSDRFDAWTPSATVSLRAPEDLLEDLEVFDHLMGYFTYSRGFRGGGFNGGARTDTAESLASFEPEFIDSYEIGIKTTAFDRRLALSTSIFQMDRKDQQVPQIVSTECDTPPCPTDVFTRNAAKSRSRGVEAELMILPYPGWSLNGSFGYVEAKFLDFPGAQDLRTGEEINRGGERFPFLPEIQGNLGLQYVLGLPEMPAVWLDGDLTTRADWYYESNVINWAPELPEIRQRGYNRINLRMSYGFNDGRSQFAVWSKNVTDEEYFKNTLAWGRLTGTAVRYYEPPRTYGVEVSHSF